eukprot:s1511_g22.t1
MHLISRCIPTRRQPRCESHASQNWELGVFFFPGRGSERIRFAHEDPIEFDQIIPLLATFCNPSVGYWVLFQGSSLPRSSFSGIISYSRDPSTDFPWMTVDVPKYPKHSAIRELE